MSLSNSIPNAALLTEEDVRAKVVTTWLRGHGFNLEDIHLEPTLVIRLGKSSWRVQNDKLERLTSASSRTSCYQGQSFRPRADILVCNGEGRNLLVVEVKSPNKVLDDDDRDQGVSYARLLEGNIAPFVVLTNGRDTRIFDSLTKIQVDGDTIPGDHPYARAGFQVGGDDLSLRSEALETLISLSPANLIAFCEAQASFRMGRLRSDDVNSGKKYIPMLYIERKDPTERLSEMLAEPNRRVVVVVGAPQIGKTNFLCHTVEQRLRQGEPCLFYPAIGIKKSLLREISDDFEWTLGDANAAGSFVVKKLRNVLIRSQKRLTIFIDGWNETNRELARDIDCECERLSCNEIQIVLSLTNVAATRLLGGSGGNPSFVGETASIGIEAAQRIEINPTVDQPGSHWSAVQIGKYSDKERDEAYSKYCRAYDVRVPDSHQRVAEPYTLGSAMKLYKRATLPDELDEPVLLQRIIEDKAARAIGLEDHDIPFYLTSLAEQMLLKDQPVPLENIATVWNLPHGRRLPSGFFDAALLAEVTDDLSKTAIDFYYGRERDFVVAYWLKNWPMKLQSKTDLSSEFVLAAQSKIGLEALRWFFSQQKHIEMMQLLSGSLPNYDCPVVASSLLHSLVDLVNRESSLDRSRLWEHLVNQVKCNSNSLVRIEAGRLAAALIEGGDELADALYELSELDDFVVGLLSVNEEYSLEQGGLGGEILDAVRDLHWGNGLDSESSEITDVLESLMDHPSPIIREGAAACLGYAAPQIFFSRLAGQIQKRSINASRLGEYATGVENAEIQLREMYYGSLCPGALESLRDDPDNLRAEYDEMSSLLDPVISAYHTSPVTERLRQILEDLRPVRPAEQSDRTSTGFSRPSLDSKTIPLPFDDPNDGSNPR